MNVDVVILRLRRIYQYWENPVMIRNDKINDNINILTINHDNQSKLYSSNHFKSNNDFDVKLIDS